ncbi:MAG: hypothetical protein IT428_05885 [Planctomycetaceae bacterium]|nr:hypothetical protein [Planctomycetaceae bacterium]
MRRTVLAAGLAAAFALLATSAQAAHRWGLKEGKPDLQSAGQLAFGPDGILFVGDAKGAAVFAIDTKDAEPGKPMARNIEKLNEKLAKVEGLKAPVAVNDLAVNPASGNIYLSVSSGETKAPALVKINGEGAMSLVSLEKVEFLKATIPNPPEDKVVGDGPRARNRRPEAITDLAYTDGKLLVAGLNNTKAASTVREYAFPFNDKDKGFNPEIYHGAHGGIENYAAIRTFVPMTIGGVPSLLAGYTCTPLVRFTLEGLEDGAKARGTTLAELGNRNQPLDMVVYEKGSDKYLLMSNTARGVMKISLKDIAREEGITEPVRTASGTAGQTYDTIKELEGTVQLDRLSNDQAVVVVQKGNELSLRTVTMP